GDGDSGLRPSGSQRLTCRVHNPLLLRYFRVLLWMVQFPFDRLLPGAQPSYNCVTLEGILRQVPGRLALLCVCGGRFAIKRFQPQRSQTTSAKYVREALEQPGYAKKPASDPDG